MNGFKISVMTLFFPIDAFATIKKQREHFAFVTPTVILLWSLFSKIINLFIVHYPLSTQKIVDINLFQQVASFLLPFFLWIIGNYFVTCIFDGEVKFREVYAATCYSLLPYAILTLPLSAFTNVVGIDFSSVMNTINSIIWIWVIILVLISVKEMNNYTVPQTAKVIFCSIVAVLFIAVVFVLLYVLGVKLWDFVAELFKEYKLLLFG